MSISSKEMEVRFFYAVAFCDYNHQGLSLLNPLLFVIIILSFFNPLLFHALLSVCLSKECV